MRQNTPLILALALLTGLALATRGQMDLHERLIALGEPMVIDAALGVADAGRLDYRALHAGAIDFRVYTE